MALIQQQKDFFTTNGYLPYTNVLDKAFLAELRREYDRVFLEAQESDAYRNIAVNDDADKRAAPVQMLQIMQMCERSLAFRRLLYHPPILDVVEDLIGPNIVLFHVRTGQRSSRRLLE